MAVSQVVRHCCLMLGLLVAGLACGCGGSGSGGLTSQPPTASLNAVVVKPSMPSVVAGTTQNFTATGAYSDNSQKDVTAEATWVSSATSVATVGATGDPQTVKALAAGTSTITATVGGVSGSTELTVTSSSTTPPKISVSPRNAAVVITRQAQQFSATVNGDPNNLGVTWSVDSIPGGSASTGTISSTGLYTPPSTAGTHTIVATSVADNTQSASANVAVTDLAGIFTYRYDVARDGVNSQEYALSPSNVNPNNFGKLFSCQVDGQVYTEPLWVPSLTVNGSVRNVIFVATQHDSLFAFDADANPCQQLWHVNLIDNTHGGTAGETPANPNIVGEPHDINPEIGVTGTPVIDRQTNTLYVVSKSQSTGPVFQQRLHAIDLISGNEKFGAPVEIAATVSGTGDGSSAGTIAFSAQTQNQRPGLALLNGVVYIAWGSHGDTPPYHGWLIGYSASNVQQQIAVFNTTPNASPSDGGIWMSGGAPAIDADGNLYFTTGNGAFDANQSTVPNNDYGDSLLKVGTSGGLSVLDYFTPDNQATLSLQDLDLSSGGVVLLPDQTGPVAHLLVTGGKDGNLFLVDRDNLGHFQSISNAQIVQSFLADQGLFDTPAFWQNRLYLSGAYTTSDVLKFFAFNPISGLFATTPASSTAHIFPYRGPNPVVSATASSNGIVWAVDSGCFGLDSSCGNTVQPAIMFAYDATDLTKELWDSTQAGTRDTAGGAVKFVVPTVANGKVYLGTGNELDVYGLLP
jgi:Bacterial Ig-like domain (group 2)